MTLAVPFTLLSALEVAVTVSVVAVSLGETTKYPSGVMVEPDPPLTLHVTLRSGSPVPLTVASNWQVSPFVTSEVDGETDTLSTLGINSHIAVISTFCAGMVNVVVALVLLANLTDEAELSHALKRCPLGALAVTVMVVPAVAVVGLAEPAFTVILYAVVGFSVTALEAAPAPTLFTARTLKV